MNKKRRIRPLRLAMLIALVVVFFISIFFSIKLLISFVTDGGIQSVNSDAGKYRYGKCVVFYPKGELGKEYAKTLCTSKDERVIDYEDESFGDFHHIIYEDLDYYTSNDYKEAKLSGIKNERAIVSSYLRYCMKKDNIDIAYTSDFLLKTSPENIDLSDVSYELLSKDEIGAYFKQYDYQARIPSVYLQGHFNEDLGVEAKELERIRYINPERPMLALTFDDGPNVNKSNGASSLEIVNTLSAYDANATFFVLGSRLSQECVDFIGTSIANGNEIGSHTYSHSYLTKQNASDIVDEITWPNKRINESFDYEMKYYRPPYGAINSDVKANQPYPAILWNVDSEDWKSRNANTVKEKVMAEVDNYDVVLFHDIYSSTAEAIRDLVPMLIDEGYQLVTISEMLEALDIDPSSISAFYGK